MSCLKSVTLRTYEELNNNDIIKEKYATPERVLDYLERGDVFKSLSANIKEIMIAFEICTDESKDNDYIDNLYERLNKLESSIPDTQPELSGVYLYPEKHIKSIFKKTPTSHETVKRWIKGTTHRIGDYNTLVKICFALELDLATSNDFLNKCGFNGFNVRNPLDAIYIYSIINKRPFSNALKLFLKYLHTPAEGAKTPVSSVNVYDRHDTTLYLENSILKNSNWGSDEAFLETFLIPHKSMFTEYSKTAFTEYEKIKNPFFLTAIKDAIDEEDEHLKIKIKNELERKEHKRKYHELLPAKVRKTDTKISYKMKNAIKKYSSENAFLANIFSLLDLGVNKYGTPQSNLSLICDKIGEYLKDTRQMPKEQFELGQFLSVVMSVDYCMFKMLPAVIGNDVRKRAFSSSKLAESVLFLFPHRQSLARYEKQPATVDNGVYVRKAIILMYYFAFAYERSAKKKNSTFFADFFSEYDFSTFIEEVNTVLARCRFAPLYPANRFDWLILRSVRQFEICDSDEELINCISFFDDVIEESFGGKHS